MMLVRVVCLQVVALRLAIGIPFVSLSSTQSPSADLENVALPLSHSDAGDPVPTPQLGTPHVLPFGIWVTSRTGENTCPAPMHIMHSS